MSKNSLGEQIVNGCTNEKKMSTWSLNYLMITQSVKFKELLSDISTEVINIIFVFDLNH